MEDFDSTKYFSMCLSFYNKGLLTKISFQIFIKDKTPSDFKKPTFQTVGKCRKCSCEFNSCIH